MSAAGVGEQDEAALVHQARQQVQQLVDVAALVEHVGGEHEMPGPAGQDLGRFTPCAAQRLDVDIVPLGVRSGSAHGVW